MRCSRGFIESALLFGCAAVLPQCDERGTTPSAPRTLAPKSPAPSGAPKEPRRATATPRERPPDSLNVSAIPEETSPAPSASAETKRPRSKLIIDQAQAIGPAGQMTASERGVLMVNRSDEVLVARRTALGVSSHPEQARFSVVPGGFNDFYAVARGPHLLRNQAYWIRDGKLVRRAWDNSTPLEILASDARNGTRVVGADLPGAPAHALYISRPIEGETPRAKLWVEGAEAVTVSPEGAGASSIAVASTGQDLFAIAIDARSAMTPVHGRSIRFKNGKPELDPDVVMWVGSTSQTLSEVFASSTPLGVRAFLPIERDTSHFGLVMLELGSAPHMDPKTVWRGYPNGIDVAPVASGSFCGAAFVAYVRPENPSPDAREVLEIAEISELGLGPAERVDGARGFANISLAAGADSAVLAYVADLRTFATTLRCTHPR